MDPVLIPILIVFIVVGLPVLSVFLLALAKILKGDGGRFRGGLTEAEETRLVQEFSRSLSNLESRLDALETVLLERERHTRTKL